MTIAENSELQRLEKLQRKFVDMRFGMFVCYNIMSYGAKVGEANYDLSIFDPQD